MALIKCRNCGNLVSDKANKCVHCGALLDSNDSVTYTNQNVTVDNVSDSSKNKSGLNVALIILLLLILVGAGIGVAIYQESKRQPHVYESEVSSSGSYSDSHIDSSIVNNEPQIAEDTYDETGAKAFASKFFKKTRGCYDLVGSNEYMTEELYKKCKPIINEASQKDPGEDPFFSCDFSEVKHPKFKVKSLGNKEFECKSCEPSMYEYGGYFVTKCRIKVDKINGKYVITNIFYRYIDKKCWML